MNVIGDVVAAFTRGVLVVPSPSPSGGGAGGDVVGAIGPLLWTYSNFLASAIDAAPALGAARACRKAHALLALTAKTSAGASADASGAAGVAGAIGNAALERLSNLDSPDVPLAKPLVFAAAGVLARVAGPTPAHLQLPPAAVADWARAAARALVTGVGDMTESELHLLAASTLCALGGGSGGGDAAIRDPTARAAATEGALRAVLALRDLRADGGGRRDAEEEEDDSEDDDSGDDDNSDDSDDSDSDDSDDDSDSGGGRGGGGGRSEDEETEAAFLQRYADEARRLADAGDEDPDAGDVDEADDGTELELEGVYLVGHPGAEATALLQWLQTQATAADLGALAATLQAHPIAGLEQVRDLQSVLSSMAAPGGGAGAGAAAGISPGKGGGGAGRDNGGVGGMASSGAVGGAGGIDFRGLRL